MLSALFSDEGFGEASRGASCLLTRPPAPRPPCNLVGLDNQGSTCYLNSLIQQLFQTPEVLVGLFSITPEALGADGPEESMRRIPLELQRLFTRMLSADEAAVSTEQLTRSFGWTGDETFQQHDVQELNRILFAAIEESLVGLDSPTCSLISRLYHGTLVNQIVCKACGSVSEREEDYQDLCVPVAGQEDLTSSLIAAYVQEEVLKGDNAYRCEQCNALVTASKGTKIRTLPPILTISLLRFNFDLRKMERYKETGRFEFPTVLDMEPFVEREPTEDDAATYDLVGVVIHRGSSFGGHYHAYIRDVLGLGNWSPPEDEPIRVADTVHLELESPQELISLILSHFGKAGLQIGRLGSEVTKMTGSSWNSRFRARHGPLVKFVKRHDHLWGFNSATQWVWALETSKETSGAADDTAKLNEGEPSVTPPMPSPSRYDEEGWFDFNDSHVSPIRSAAISSQFSGKECAYLLTFRSRALSKRCSGVDIDVAPPEWLRAEVAAQNDEWHRQREEYDLRTHAVTVELLDSRHVTLEAGALRIREDVEAETVRMDCRKPLQALLDLLPPDGQNAVSLLSQGLEIALYAKEDLKNGDVTRSLSSAGVANGAKLLLWDGVQINGVPWPHCSEIPFRMTAQCSFMSPELSVRVHGCRTPLTLCLLEHWPGVRLEAVRVSLVLLTAHGEPELRLLSAEELCSCAEDLHIKGEARLLLSDGSAPESSVSAANTEFPQPHQHLNAVVRNNLTQEDNSPRYIIPFDSDTTVLDFRKEALHLSGFSAVDEMAADFRLRVSSSEEDGDLGPPLIDDWRMMDCGLGANSKVEIVLERGPSIPADHIFLTLTPWDASGECALVVSKDVTLSEIKETAFTALFADKNPSLAPSQLSLQLLSWCDMPARTFRDESLSLRSAPISHGDRLLLARSSAPPYGTAAVPLFWRRLSEAAVLSVNSLSWRSEGQALTEEVETNAGEGELRELGELRIPMETSVAELKVLAMDRLRDDGNVEVVPDHVRMRAIEEGVPRAVLKAPNQTVQRARLSSCRGLCLDVLPHNQQPAPSDVLLAIRLRDDPSRSYSQPLETIWRSSDGATSASLHEHLRSAMATSLPFRLAKRMANRRRWLPLPLASVRPAAVPGKKKGIAKEPSLLRAPFGVRDGDVIAVKFVADEAAVLMPEDFDSEEDVAERLKMEEAAAARRNRRNAAGPSWFVGTGGGGECQRIRRPEVPLVIRVQRFT